MMLSLAFPPMTILHPKSNPFHAFDLTTNCRGTGVHVTADTVIKIGQAERVIMMDASPEINGLPESWRADESADRLCPRDLGRKAKPLLPQSDTKAANAFPDPMLTTISRVVYLM